MRTQSNKFKRKEREVKNISGSCFRYNVTEKTFTPSFRAGIKEPPNSGL